MRISDNEPSSAILSQINNFLKLESKMRWINNSVMIIGLFFVYNFNLSWMKHDFSRGMKLLRVFQITLYILYRIS